MSKRADPTNCDAFFAKYAAQLEAYFSGVSGRLITGFGRKELVDAARRELGYSQTTSAIDIISPLRRGFITWKARQAMARDGANDHASPQEEL
jgi:hypothetical protein